jgi:hypothetical protein
MVAAATASSKIVETTSAAQKAIVRHNLAILPSRTRILLYRIR